MMSLIFLLLLISLIFSWKGKAKVAKTLLLLTLVIAISWYFHHASSQLNIQL